MVETVTDREQEISLEDARRIDPAAEIGGEVRIPKNMDALGRIAAQTAKQVIMQKVREAERETVHSEFSGRVGELVNCTVKGFEGPDIIVDIGKTEARLPKKEQSKLESFSIGERIRCVIKSVEKTVKNAGVIVSRADAEFVKRLFEQEVPEIYDNTVVIKACAREAGERTKIAVQSRDRDVDSVGACVGMKGMRVQSIIRELRGEKIDIIEYSAEPGEDLEGDDPVGGRPPHGSRRGRFATFASDRQAGAERAPGGKAHRLAGRHQERRRETPGVRISASQPTDPRSAGVGARGTGAG